MSKRAFNCRPGFNEHVKELHDIARKRFVAWREANKPRDTNNPFFREMNRSRAKFKLALRYIKRHENQLRQDAIDDVLFDDSEGNFWKEIKKLTPNNIPLAINVDDTIGIIFWTHLPNVDNGSFECRQGPGICALSVDV